MAIFVEERAASEWDLCEATFAIVKANEMILAEFLGVESSGSLGGFENEIETVGQFRRCQEPTIHCIDHRLSVNDFNAEVGVWLITQCDLTVVRNIKIQSSVSIEVTEGEGHTGMVRIQAAAQWGFSEVPIAIIEKNMAATCDGVDQKVQIAIAVDIGEAGAGDVQAGATDAGGGSYIFEVPIPQIPKEVAVPAKSGEEKITPSIAVNVASRNAGAIEENLVGELPLLGEEIGEEEASSAIVHEREARFSTGVNGDLGITEALPCLPIQTRAGLNKGEQKQRG